MYSCPLLRHLHFVTSWLKNLLSLSRAELNEDGDLLFVYWERKDIDDIEYIVEVSEDLVIWNRSEPFVEELSRQSGQETNLEEVRVIGHLSNGAVRGFLRLLVQKK